MNNVFIIIIIVVLHITKNAFTRVARRVYIIIYSAQPVGRVNYQFPRGPRHRIVYIIGINYYTW